MITRHDIHKKMQCGQQNHNWFVTQICPLFLEVSIFNTLKCRNHDLAIIYFMKIMKRHDIHKNMQCGHQNHNLIVIQIWPLFLEANKGYKKGL